MRHIRLALLMLAALLGAVMGAAPAPRAETADEKLLREHGVPTDGPGLIEHLRRSASEAVSDEKIKALVEQLGDDSFDRREEASRQLVLLGRQVKKPLTEALRHPDLEVRSRARACLKEIDKDGGSGLRVSLAAIRVLARRQPPGTAAALFGMLGRAEDDSVVAEVREALVRAAVKDGKPDPVLLAGLKGKLPVHRATAGAVLCLAKADNCLPAVRKLLDDPDVQVRAQVALALLQTHHREGMPPLLALLDLPSSRLTGLVEDMLVRLAGDKAPPLPAPAAARGKHRKAWEDWWAAQGGKIGDAALEERARFFGRTTVVLLDDNAVLDLDASNRVRWKVEGVGMPLDVQRLSGERVLLAEYKGNRVTERNSKGEVVWQKMFPQPLMAQRLDNGHTFIANQDGVVEVDRQGKAVFTYTRPGGEQIMRARKLPSGDIVLITQLGASRFVRLDRNGREVKTFGVEVGTSGGRIDLTRNGTVLIAELYNNRVVERDMEGKVLREVEVQQPIAVAALPNGHFIATSMSQKRAVEIDRAGKEVWEFRRDTRVTRAVRY
jgi:hypothetical protein